MGLIEVLVALVIASVALLGLAGLQVNALRFQKVAHFRGLAAQHNAEMADRIRANMKGAIAGNYATAAAATYADGKGTKPTCAITDKCTATEIASLDIYNWRTNLERGMTQGWGEISGNVANGFTITSYFREPGKKDGSLDANCRSTALAAADKDVRCFRMVFVP